jgi:hypothetical protein
MDPTDRFLFFVIAGLDPAIQAEARTAPVAWMRGSSPRMTK